MKKESQEKPSKLFTVAAKTFATLCDSQGPYILLSSGQAIEASITMWVSVGVQRQGRRGDLHSSYMIEVRVSMDFSNLENSKSTENQ